MREVTSGTVEIVDVRVEGQTHAVGLDTPPRITWVVKSGLNQITITYAQVTVTCLSTGETIADSGLMTADLCAYQCDQIDWRTLTRYRVNVEVHGSWGTARGSSEFVSGVVTEEEPWTWITAPETDGGVPRVATEFEWHGEESFLVLAVAGIARVVINGIEMDDVLVGGITDFDRRVHYRVWELAHGLRRGSNVIEVDIGRGFYALAEPNVWNWEAARWRSTPAVAGWLRIGDRMIRTDRVWRATSSGTRYNDLYGGESFDATWEPRWRSAQEVIGPRGVLLHQPHQPIRVAEQWHPVEIFQDGDGWIVDAGRVTSGWLHLHAVGHGVSTVTIDYGEQLLQTGEVNNDDPLGYFNGRFQRDEWTLRGDGAVERWRPAFSWKGFRYARIRGWPDPNGPRAEDVLVEAVHSAVERTGSFSCSHALMVEIHEATVRTVLNNLHGIPTDTPMFEKNGWTGDGMLATELMLANLDSSALLTKWVGDIADTRPPGGAPSVIAPDGGWRTDWSPAPPWHSAFVLIPWWLSQHTGDSRVLHEHWSDMLEYVLFEYARADRGIATSTLGDWVSPETGPGGGNPPEDIRVSATAYLFHMLRTMTAAAREVGCDPTPFARRAEVVRREFLRTFYRRDQASVVGEGDDGYRQTHHVLAVVFGLIPRRDRARVVAGLADDIARRGGRLNTGLLGTKYLLPVLTDNGQADTAFGLASSTQFPSWGYWIANGATTLWEHWSLHSRSRDHYALGTIDDWFFGSVAGIRRQAAGWRRVDISPRLAHRIEAAEASIVVPGGRLSVAYRVHRSRMQLTVDVPVGVVAAVRIPSEFGTRLAVDASRAIHGARPAADGGGRVELPSGQWTVRSG